MHRLRIPVGIERPKSFAKNGDWAFIRPQTVVPGEYIYSLVRFLNPDETYIGGLEMLDRANAKQVRGNFQHALALLDCLHDTGPSLANSRIFQRQCLIFPCADMIYQGVSYVAYVYWDGKQWTPGWGRLRESAYGHRDWLVQPTLVKAYRW